MRRSTASLIVGLIAGSVIGLLAGLLLAPDSGERTRRRLAGQALRAAEAAHTLADQAEHVVETIGERVGHALGRDEENAWRKVQEIRAGIEGYTQTQTS